MMMTYDFIIHQTSWQSKAVFETLWKVFEIVYHLTFFLIDRELVEMVK